MTRKEGREHMWVMTSEGIYMPALRPVDTISPGDDRVLQIRSRRAVDLDRLRARFMPTTLGRTIYLGNTDYEYRAYCTRDAWAVAMARMAYATDYVKFKDTAADRDLHEAFLDVWYALWNRFSKPRLPASRRTKNGRRNSTVRLDWWDDILLGGDAPRNQSA
jgi:hypothetical protein